VTGGKEENGRAASDTGLEPEMETAWTSARRKDLAEVSRNMEGKGRGKESGQGKEKRRKREK